MTTDSRTPDPGHRAPDNDPESPTPSLRIRPIAADDASQVDEILHKVSIFYNFEIIVAMELINEALKGNDDYIVHVAEWTSGDVIARSEATKYPRPDRGALLRQPLPGQAQSFPDPDPDPGFKKPVVGYVCFGHNPMTDALYDLYWIAVHPKAQGTGVARALLTHTEREVKKLRGRGVIIETSGRAEYEPAKRLYEACGYARVAEIPDFYKPGDPRLIYLKLL